MTSSTFSGIAAHLKYYYIILLTRMPDSKSMARHGGDRWYTPAISNTENRAFLEFIKETVPENGWQIKQPGTKILHLWTTNDDWEMLLKLSERFSHHYTGIISKEVRNEP